MPLHAVHLPDDKKHNKGHNHKIDERVDELTITDSNRFGFSGLFLQHPGPLLKIDIPDQKSNGRHNDVIDQRTYDFVESRTNDDADCQVDHIPSDGEFLKL